VHYEATKAHFDALNNLGVEPLAGPRATTSNLSPVVKALLEADEHSLAHFGREAGKQRPAVLWRAGPVESKGLKQASTLQPEIARLVASGVLVLRHDDRMLAIGGARDEIAAGHRSQHYHRRSGFVKLKFR
jgi:hypothetical protein